MLSFDKRHYTAAETAAVLGLMAGTMKDLETPPIAEPFVGDLRTALSELRFNDLHTLLGDNFMYALLAVAEMNQGPITANAIRSYMYMWPRFKNMAEAGAAANGPHEPMPGKQHTARRAFTRGAAVDAYEYMKANSAHGTVPAYSVDLITDIVRALNTFNVYALRARYGDPFTVAFGRFCFANELYAHLSAVAVLPGI